MVAEEEAAEAAAVAAAAEAAAEAAAAAPFLLALGAAGGGAADEGGGEAMDVDEEGGAEEAGAAGAAGAAAAQEWECKADTCSSAELIQEVLDMSCDYALLSLGSRLGPIELTDHSSGAEMNMEDADVQKCFRRIARKIHPDQNLHSEEEAGRAMQKLNAAYDAVFPPQLFQLSQLSVASPGGPSSGPSAAAEATVQTAAWQREGWVGQHFGKSRTDPPPLTLLPSPSQPVQIVRAAPLPEEMGSNPKRSLPILGIYHRFIELILQGIKTVELRTFKCPHEGKRIALCSLGAGSQADGFYVLGTAVVDGSVQRPAAARDAKKLWHDSMQNAACVGGEWPGNYPWAWELRDVCAFDKPVRYITGMSGAGTLFRYIYPDKGGRSWVEDT